MSLYKVSGAVSRFPTAQIPLAAFLLFSAICASPHVSCLSGYRLFFGFIYSIFLFLFLFSIGFNICVKKNYIALIPMVFSLSDIILRGNVLGAASWLLCALSICALNSISVKKVIFVIKILFYVNLVLIYGGMVLTVSSSSLFVGTSIFGSDTMVNFQTYGFQLPRFTYYLIQSSLIPAYIMLPYAILVSFGVVSRISAVLMIVAIVMSLGGSVYAALASSLFIMIFPFMQRYSLGKIYVVINVIFIIYVSNLYWGVDIYSYVPPLISHEQNYIVDRSSSGNVRLILIGMQAKEIIRSYGVGSTGDIVLFGNMILTAGLRAGLVGMILIVIIYAKLFNLFGYVFRKSVWGGLPLGRKFGFSLLLALLIQSFIYNDYGFSLQYGFIMLFLLFRIMICLCNGRFGVQFSRYVHDVC